MKHTVHTRHLAKRGFTTHRVPTPQGTLQLLNGPGEGQGPPLVLVHGVSGRGAVFGRVARTLRAHCRQLFLPDLLGHGDSDVPEAGLTVDDIQHSFDQLMLQEVPEGAVLVGVSMGGMLVAQHAARHGQRLAGVMLCNPGGAPVSPEAFEASRRLLTPKNHQDAKLLAQAALGHRSGLLQHIAAVALRRRLSVPHIQAFLSAAHPGQSLQPTALHGISIPVRLLIGGKDNLLPEGSMAWYQEHLPPSGTVVHLPNAGHTPMIDDPALFSAEVVAFLETLPPA